MILFHFGPILGAGGIATHTNSTTNTYTHAHTRTHTYTHMHTHAHAHSSDDTKRSAVTWRFFRGRDDKDKKPT